MHLSPRNPRMLIAASALALVAAAFFFVYGHLHAIQVGMLTKAHGLIESALQEALGRRVTVGTITSAGLDSVVLGDVAVPAQPGEGTGAPVFEVRQVIVDYSLLDLVFRREPLVATVTSITLVEPVLRAGLGPDGRVWPTGLFDPSRLSPAAGGAQGFSGSVSVRQGRLEVAGVPGMTEAVVLDGVEGTLSFVPSGLAWRASAQAGPKGELRLSVTGTLDGAQGGLACDAVVSGAVPPGLLDAARRVFDSEPDMLARVGLRVDPKILAYLDAAGDADIAGGKLEVDVHIRPEEGGGRLIRGEVTLAEAHVTATQPVPGVTNAEGLVNLASEFQADSQGFSCQGKGSISVQRAECDGTTVGLGRFDVSARAGVDFWQKAGEELCFEGSADLDASRVSMGDAVRAALAKILRDAAGGRGSFDPGAHVDGHAQDGGGGAAADDAVLDVEGPLAVSLAFAGKASSGVEVRGKVAMSGGHVVARNVVHELQGLSGDVGWEIEFTRDAKGVLQYTGRVQSTRASVKTGPIAGVGDFAGDISAALTFSGAMPPAGMPAAVADDSRRQGGVALGMVPAYNAEVTIISGTARTAYPSFGLTSAKGAVSGRVTLNGAGSGSAEYSGTLKFTGASIALARPQAGLKSFETGASGTIEFGGVYPGKAKFQGSVDLEDGSVVADTSGAGVKSASGEARTRGTVLFSGEYPGRIEYRGTLDASRGRVAVREGPGGLARLDVAAQAHVDFEGEYPGGMRFQASCSFPEGEAEIVKGPGGIESASGRAIGNVSVSGSLPGNVDYGGHIVFRGASVRLANAPGGVESLSGVSDVVAEFTGSSAGDLRYSGSAKLLSGQLLAVNVPGGIRSLKGPAQGTLSFTGVYPEPPELEGSVSVTHADFVAGEVPGVAKSVSGRVTGEIAFRVKDGDVQEYSGKAAVGPATFVSDGVYPGVEVARGPVRLDVEFSGARGEALSYKGKATVSGGDLRAKGLFPGLADLAGKVDSSFDFESTAHGVKYEGSANIATGRAVLGGGAVPGLERMDGNVVASVDFRGEGGKTATYSGKAQIFGGTLVAGEVAKGIERIEGPSSLAVAFSGGIGTRPVYTGTVSVRDASFRAGEMVSGMKSVAGKVSGSVSFAVGADGTTSYEGSADLKHASFAAGAVYPGIRELGGNGEAHLTFSNKGGSGVKGTADIVVTGGVLAHDAIGGRVEDIAAEISAREDLVEIKGMTGRLGTSWVEASGWLRPGKRVEIDLALKSKDLVLADLGNVAFGGAGGGLAILAGNAAVDVTLKGYYPDIQWAGQIALKGVTVKHPALGGPFEGISGLIAFSGRKMSTESLKMTIAGVPVTARGDVTNLPDPRFDVTLSFADADIQKLAAFLAPGAVTRGVAGRGSITARLTGSAQELFAEGSMDLAALTVPVNGKAVAVPHVTGRFRYGEGALALRDVTAQVAGGRIAVQGAVMLGSDGRGAPSESRRPSQLTEPGRAGGHAAAGASGGSSIANPAGSVRSGAGNLPAVQFTAELKGVSAANLASLLLPSSVAFSGTVDGNLVVTGGGPGGAEYGVAGSCRVADGRVAVTTQKDATFSFTSLETSFRVAGGDIAFDHLVVRGADGDIDARGTVSQAGEVNVSATVKGASLAKLARFAGYDGVSGTAGFAGIISGRGENVTIDGLADVGNGSVAGIKFDALAGRVRLSRGEVSLNAVSVRKGKASCLISGKVGLDSAGGSALDLALELAGVPCEDVLSLVGATGSFPLKGVLSGEVTVKGTPANPIVRGSVESSGVELSGVKLDSAAADFSFAGGAVRFERLDGKVGPARVAASGTVSRDGAVDLSVNVDDVDLARMPFAIPGNLVSAGVATFQGKVTGESKRPRVEGRVSATNVVFRGVLFPDVAGVVKWDGESVAFAPLTVGDASGCATVTGSVTPSERAPGDVARAGLDLEIAASGLRLRTVLDLVQPGYGAEVDGKVTGRVVVRGSVASPAVEMALEASDVNIAGIAFSDGALDAFAKAGGIELRLLRLRQKGGGYLEASGTGTRGGPISFMASAQGFDASVLPILLGVKYAVSGTLDLAARIEGTSSDPSANVAMQLAGGAVEKVKFDSATAKMLFEDGVVTIEQAEIVQGRHKASVTGTVPLAGRELAALGITPPKTQKSLDLAVTMKGTSLVLLTMVSDQIEWSEGTANVDLHVTGSFGAPQLHGYVTLSDGTVKLAPLEDALKNVAAKIAFNGTEASVEEFSCRLGDGTVSVSGSVGFQSGGGPKLDLRIAGKRAKVNTGLLRALVDASLAVYGPVKRPLISGDIKLAKAEVAPSGFAGASVPFDADLALTVATEGDLRIRTKTMDIPASGTIKVGGTLKQPALAGRVEAHRGWFAYFGNEFTIQEALAEFREDAGIMPYLDVQAETYAGSTDITLVLRGTPPDGLTLDFTSSPPKSRDEILALLNYPGALARILEGDVEGAMKEEIARIFDQELRLQLVSGIERAFEDALSLDEFRLQRGTSNELTLKIGKYVVDDLYVSYERGFGPQSSGVLRFDYVYGPGIVLTGKFDDRGIYTFGLEARLRF
ncbi:MAG: translocation/assembly module TamB domain-containing protein [Betaproteobacteria bacterium]